MSYKQYKTRCFSAQSAQAKARSVSHILKHFQFNDDPCPPNKLSTRELKERLAVHMVQLGQLQPSSPQYDIQLAFILAYDGILQQRESNITTTQQLPFSCAC